MFQKERRGLEGRAPLKRAALIVAKLCDILSALVCLRLTENCFAYVSSRNAINDSRKTVDPDQ
jgi:hypothetical protein